MTRVKVPIADLVRIHQRLRTLGLRSPGEPALTAAPDPRISCRGVKLAAKGRDEPSRMVFVDERLVAIFTLVGSEEEPDPEIGTGWYLEVGFGRCEGGSPALFETFDAGLAWVAQRLHAP